MLVKFLKAKYGDGHGAVNYCLNERVTNGTARILKGDEQKTRAIISAMPHKNKVEFGVLSFENGAKITERQKYEIMNDFENMLLGNMKERVNILWVEHTDKGRLELNFIIPKIDLESGKAFTPYFYSPKDENALKRNYSADAMKINLWTEKINYYYDLEHPNDPRKGKTISTSPTHKQFKTIAELDEHLHFMTDNELLNSRAEIIDYIKNELKLEIKTRKDGTYPSDYLQIKLDDTNKYHRLKANREGQIYDERFTNQTELAKLNGEVESRIDKFANRNAELIIAENERRITELIKARNNYNERRFFKERKRATRQPRQEIRNNQRTLSETISDNAERDANAINATIAEPTNDTKPNAEYNALQDSDIAFSDDFRGINRGIDYNAAIEITQGDENDTARIEANEYINGIRNEIQGISTDHEDTQTTIQATRNGNSPSNSGAKQRNREIRSGANQERARIDGERKGITENRARTRKQRSTDFSTSAEIFTEAYRRRKRKTIATAYAERIKRATREYYERITERAKQIKSAIDDRINAVRNGFKRIADRFNGIRKRRAERERRLKEIQKQKETYFYRTYNLKFDIDIGENNGYAYPIYRNKIIFGEIEVKSEYEINQNKDLNKNDYLPISKFNADLLQTQSDPQERYKLAHKMNLDITQTQEQYQQMQKQQGEAMRQIAQQEINNREKSSNIWKMR